MVGIDDGQSDVVIVGAGPVGLAAAIELGVRGIRCVVVERNDRVGYSPRAKTDQCSDPRAFASLGDSGRATPRVTDRTRSSLNCCIRDTHEWTAHCTFRERA